jgi:alpha-glucosidase
MNHVGERPADPLTLLLHPAAGAKGGETTLYEDAGDGFAHESGEYARRSVLCEATEGETTIRLTAREGSFAPGREHVVLELRGMDARPASVTANGAQAEWSFDESAGALSVTLPESANETTVTVGR